MTAKTATSKRSRSRMSGDRPTIGLLTFDIAEPVGRVLWGGVVSGAEKAGATLVCFPGDMLRHPTETRAQANVLYDLASAERLDGLIIWSALLHFADAEAAAGFYERYHPLPIVSVGQVLEGVPSVVADNYHSMRQVLVHLIEGHGARRIAFIHGPTGSQEAGDRYRAYVDALSAYDLPFDSNLVAPGNNTIESGVRAIGLLLDERGLAPQVDLDALVAANDTMLRGALDCLQTRGVRVPGHLLAAGFDDHPESAYLIPPLTTVRYPFHEIGQRAAEMLVELIEGRAVPELETLSMDLIVRRSCGCLSPQVVAAAAEPAGGLHATEAELPTVDAWREDVLSDVQKTMAAGALPEAAILEGLLDGFVVQVQDGSGDSFLSSLNLALRQAVRANGNVTHWQGVITAMRRHTLPFAKDALGAENLLQQARVLIDEVALEARMSRQFQAERMAQRLRRTSQSLGSISSIQELRDVILDRFPHLGISSCYIALYETPSNLTEWAGLIIAYEEGERVELDAAWQRFPSRRLVPDELWDRGRRRTLVVESLYFGDSQYGFVVFEGSIEESRYYEALRDHISSTLQVSHLVQQTARRAVQLQTAAEVSRSASGVLDPEQLIRQVVELARERFDLYYAGLFLVDKSGEWTLEPDRWLVLRAGTGKAGHQMLAQNHKLEVGGDSMVGWCVANKRARIALDVGEEAVRFDNPLLPLTRSELALPLVSRDEAIGALTIQSTREAAFSDEDIAVLQAMADQLANAITNARLYSQAQEEVVERQRAEEALARQAKALDAELEQIFFVSSHHLQEPLRMVVSYSQLLKQRYGDLLDTEGDEFIGHAVDGAIRIQTLINDMLAFSRVGTRSSRLSTVDCSVVIERVLNHLRLALQETDAVVTQGSLPTITADEALLTQLFENLVENALKFRSDHPPEIHIQAVERKDEWLFSVQDNGIGFEPQHHERVFRIFQRLHTGAQYPGTGIGLAICKKIVELHDGRIWVESEPGQGSTFYFTLPFSLKARNMARPR